MLHLIVKNTGNISLKANFMMRPNLEMCQRSICYMFYKIDTKGKKNILLNSSHLNHQFLIEVEDKLGGKEISRQ